MPALAPIPVGGSGAGNVPPVVTSSDVLAILPAFVQGSDPAPVRDGLVAALTAIMLAYQAAGQYAAWQSDVLHAEGTYLDGLGSDRKTPRQPSETEPAYRARLLGIPSLVTPTAILAGVNAILAPFTTVQAQYFESVLDRWYTRSTRGASTGFHSFTWKRSTTARLRAPQYPDRLYQDDAAANGGRWRAQSSPGGARTFKGNDHLGRYLLLRVPDLSPVNNSGAFVFATNKDANLSASLLYWTPSTLYTGVFSGAKYPVPSVLKQNGYWYKVFVAGTSGLVEPVWPTLAGQTVVDGTVTWICQGALFPIGLGFFTRTRANGGSPYGAYVRARGASAASVYAAICSLVDRIKGSSIRFEMLVDSTLV